ncbi:hypothetical protein SAMN05216371_0012 [Streptomyces sp. TLI_053]|uniref:hypothetical protein n=1 Tax=Streptomyces sp. TLI_053 TaxID=1855352 RepID=UPI00087AA84B|nr:hypothetical protein [Streptomyces sp. TLI_053]SDS48168.1 hypothetical protein SAMN05216371_0012 [Streptomyces sp. TLI_053]
MLTIGLGDALPGAFHPRVRQPERADASGAGAARDCLRLPSEAVRAANAGLRPCWTCRGSIGGDEDSELELTEKAGPDRLECPGCEHERQEKRLGPLVLPAPTKREQVAALVLGPDDPWREVRVLHAKLYPVKDRAA